MLQSDENIENTIDKLNDKFENSKPKEILEYFLNEYGDKCALSSSLAMEDQVLTHMLININPKARIFTLDTGRLPQETYDVMAFTMERYNMKFEITFPDSADIIKMEEENGPNLFYKSIDNRKKCCYLRKVKPMMTILKDLNVWITGMRSAQSVTRTDLKKISFDKANGVIKVNPILDFSYEECVEFVKNNDIPYNKLHDIGYGSIGCTPCTRATTIKEESRAGRWWWEEPEHKECGLHSNSKGDENG